MAKERKEKFFALNWWDKDVWIEYYIGTQTKAEKALARNNPQLILSEEEAKKLFLELAKEFSK